MIASAHQPHFLPWIGYINRIYLSDVFVITDNMEYTKYNYLSRNRITGSTGIIMLTVPIAYKGASKEPINNIRLDSKQFQSRIKKHIRSLEHNYRKQAGFDEFSPLLFKELLKEEEHLLNLNVRLIQLICNYLSITTRIVLASELNISGKKEDDLFTSILRQTGCSNLLLGLGGSKEYINKTRVQESGYKVLYQFFKHPEYIQKCKEFVKGVSVIDLIFNTERNTAIEMVKQAGSIHE